MKGSTNTCRGVLVMIIHLPPAAGTICSTRLVEETGGVAEIKQSSKSIELTVGAKVCARRLKIGDSVAVNSCCLTVVKLKSRSNRKLIQIVALSGDYPN